MTALTPRQREIINLRLQGLMHKQIARQLCITEPTVRNTISKAYERLDIPRQGFYHEKLRRVRQIVEQEATS